MFRDESQLIRNRNSILSFPKPRVSAQRQRLHPWEILAWGLPDPCIPDPSSLCGGHRPLFVGVPPPFLDLPFRILGPSALSSPFMVRPGSGAGHGTAKVAPRATRLAGRGRSRRGARGLCTPTRGAGGAGSGCQERPLRCSSLHSSSPRAFFQVSLRGKKIKLGAGARVSGVDHLCVPRGGPRNRERVECVSGAGGVVESPGHPVRGSRLCKGKVVRGSGFWTGPCSEPSAWVRTSQSLLEL